MAQTREENEIMGAHIQALRNAAGMTQAELAAAVSAKLDPLPGIRGNAVSGWERAINGISTRTLAEAVDDVLHADGEIVRLAGYIAAHDELLEHMTALTGQMEEVFRRLGALETKRRR